MKDVNTIDFKQPYGKVIEGDPAKISKQKVFFNQNGIDYDNQGNACDPKQVKAFHISIVKDAQKTADEAKAIYENAQADADALKK